MDTISIWQGTTVSRTHFPLLRNNLTVDVAIIGGGITGVSLAMLLADAGKSVALLESQTLGCSSTGYSTGNLYEVISQGLYCIGEKWGQEVMRDVGKSRRQALDFIEHTINR